MDDQLFHTIGHSYPEGVNYNLLYNTNIVIFFQISKLYIKKIVKVMKFNGYEEFESKLEYGNKVEDGVCSLLKEMGCDARRTPQKFDERDPELGNVDIVIYEWGKPVLGIECKTMDTIYRLAGPENIPLNHSSLMSYLGVPFKVWILGIRKWDKMVVAAPLEKVMETPHTIQPTKYKDTNIDNYDTTGWEHFSSVKDALNWIINT